MLFEAMQSDMRRGVTAAHWHSVLYVLLEKPAPNDPEVVAQMREIALMAQDMKMALRMVRAMSYARVTGRVNVAQMGWVGGYGAGDPALALECVIDMQRRARQPLWILYIDLATFFPKIRRDLSRKADLTHGLPAEVVDLVERIFGAHGELEAAVRCRYDSAHGLGGEWRNHMGALMGDVLSPDRAKVLLNTVVVAIAAVARGVRMWGCRGEGAEKLREEVLQIMYADDWCGTFETVEQLTAAWHVWRVWEPMTGSKLGIRQYTKASAARGELKCAVTGVRYVQGKAVCGGDPRLRTAAGVAVPFIGHNETYKHMGIFRRADGAWATQYRHVRKNSMR